MATALAIAGIVLLVPSLLPNAWNFGLYLASRVRGTRDANRMHTHAKPADEDANEPGRTPSFAVIVCAHNEEHVIARCVDSIRAQEYPRFECFVVADNCTDATARVARSVGAVVFERFSKGASTKGAALRYGIEQAMKYGRFDCFCVFDSDNDVEPGFLTSVAQRLATGCDAVSGQRLSSNANDSLVSSLYTAYWSMVQAMYGQSHATFGLNVPASGTGFAFRSDLWKDRWRIESLTEDCEISVQICLDGAVIGYEPDARCRDEQPSDVRTMISQLRRWRTGNGQVFRRYLLPVAGQLLRAPSIRSWDTLMLLCQYMSTDLFAAGLALLAIACQANGNGAFALGIFATSWVFMTCIGVFAVAQQSSDGGASPISRKGITALCYPLFLLALGLVGLSTWFAPSITWNRVEHTGTSR